MVVYSPKITKKTRDVRYRETVITGSWLRDRLHGFSGTTLGGFHSSRLWVTPTMVNGGCRATAKFTSITLCTIQSKRLHTCPRAWWSSCFVSSHFICVYPRPPLCRRLSASLQPGGYTPGWWCWRGARVSALEGRWEVSCPHDDCSETRHQGMKIDVVWAAPAPPLFAARLLNQRSAA